MFNIFPSMYLYIYTDIYIYIYRYAYLFTALISWSPFHKILYNSHSPVQYNSQFSIESEAQYPRLAFHCTLSNNNNVFKIPFYKKKLFLKFNSFLSMCFFMYHILLLCYFVLWVAFLCAYYRVRVLNHIDTAAKNMLGLSRQRTILEVTSAGFLHSLLQLHSAMCPKALLQSNNS